MPYARLKLSRVSVRTPGATDALRTRDRTNPSHERASRLVCDHDLIKPSYVVLFGNPATKNKNRKNTSKNTNTKYPNLTEASSLS